MSGGGGAGDGGGATGPPALFVTEVVLEYERMSFSPNKADFETGMEKVDIDQLTMSMLDYSISQWCHHINQRYL